MLNHPFALHNQTSYCEWGMSEGRRRGRRGKKQTGEETSASASHIYHTIHVIATIANKHTCTCERGALIETSEWITVISITITSIQVVDRSCSSSKWETISLHSSASLIYCITSHSICIHTHSFIRSISLRLLGLLILVCVWWSGIRMHTHKWNWKMYERRRQQAETSGAEGRPECRNREWEKRREATAAGELKRSAELCNNSSDNYYSCTKQLCVCKSFADENFMVIQGFAIRINRFAYTRFNQIVSWCHNYVYRIIDLYTANEEKVGKQFHLFPSLRSHLFADRLLVEVYFLLPLQQNKANRGTCRLRTTVARSLQLFAVAVTVHSCFLFICNCIN